jgi:protein TonB
MRPSEADALAQSDLNGGGNTSEERRAKSPLPAISDDPQFTPEQAIRRESRLREEARRLMTRAKSNYSVANEQNPTPQSDNQNTTGEDLVQKSLEIARLESQISKDYDAYQKQPRRKFIGARTREYRFAQYVEDWRVKLERIGNLNYPEAARQNKIYGSLQLTVSIRADGSVESVEVNRSSGQPILDAAAMRIVKLAAPFPPLPADIRKDTDILSITRTWTFTQSDKLESE